MKVARSVSRTVRLSILIAGIVAFFSPQSCEGVEIITYGEPCTSRQYSVELEGPRPPVKEVPQKAKIDMKYYVDQEINVPPPREYPISIEVPIVPPTPEKLVEQEPSCPYVKSYDININVPPPPPKYTGVKTYDTEVEVLPEPVTIPGEPSSEKPVKLLTGLTSRVDKILIPACELAPLTTQSQY